MFTRTSTWNPRFSCNLSRSVNNQRNMSLKSAEDEDVLMRIFQDIPRYPNFHLNHIQNYRARMTRMSSEAFFLRNQWAPAHTVSRLSCLSPVSEEVRKSFQSKSRVNRSDSTWQKIGLSGIIWDHIFHIYATLVGFILVFKKAAFDLPNIFKVSKVDPCRHTR